MKRILKVIVAIILMTMVLLSTILCSFAATSNDATLGVQFEGTRKDRVSFQILDKSLLIDDIKEVIKKCLPDNRINFVVFDEVKENDGTIGIISSASYTVEFSFLFNTFEEYVEICSTMAEKGPINDGWEPYAAYYFNDSNSPFVNGKYFTENYNALLLYNWFFEGLKILDVNSPKIDYVSELYINGQNDNLLDKDKLGKSTYNKINGTSLKKCDVTIEVRSINSYFGKIEFTASRDIYEKLKNSGIELGDYFNNIKMNSGDGVKLIINQEQYIYEFDITCDKLETLQEKFNDILKTNNTIKLNIDESGFVSDIHGNMDVFIDISHYINDFETDNKDNKINVKILDNNIHNVLVNKNKAYITSGNYEKTSNGYIIIKNRMPRLINIIEFDWIPVFNIAIELSKPSKNNIDLKIEMTPIIQDVDKETIDKIEKHFDSGKNFCKSYSKKYKSLVFEFFEKDEDISNKVSNFFNSVGYMDSKIDISKILIKNENELVYNIYIDLVGCVNSSSKIKVDISKSKSCDFFLLDYEGANIYGIVSGSLAFGKNLIYDRIMSKRTGDTTRIIENGKNACLYYKVQNQFPIWIIIVIGIIIVAIIIFVFVMKEQVVRSILLVTMKLFNIK